MTRDEAERRAEELTEAAEPGSLGRWMVQEAKGGGWQVVQVSVPGINERGPLKESVEARPRPPTADDPRPSGVQQAPPFGAA